MATTFSEIINSETPTLVDFFCRMVRSLQNDDTDFRRLEI
jgi:hypothetical protein